ncbi:MAG: outer membrane protein transport protein [Pseudomonadota bacterium]
MTRTHSPIRHPIATLATLLFSTAAMAGGADNPSLSAASLGFAGASSAAANNPDTIYYNPAGMVRIKRATVSNGLTLISAKLDVRDDGTTRVQDPRQPPCSDGNGNCLKPENPNDPGTFLPGFQPIPNLYVVKPVSDTVTVGLGVFTQLGAKVAYKSGWFGSGFLEKGSVESVTINPSLALRFDDKHSIGLGIAVEAMRVRQQAGVDVEQSSKYITEAILRDANSAGLLGIPLGQVIPLGDLYSQLLPGPGKDLLGAVLLQSSNIGGKASISYEGFGAGLGWNAGYLYQLDEQTRFSLAYRSRIDTRVKGEFDWDLSKLTGTVPNLQDLSKTSDAKDYITDYYRPDADGRTTVIDPERLSLGFFHSPTPQWDVMADVSWAGQSAVQELRLRIADRKDPDGNTVSQGDAVIPQHWRDTYRISVGSAYKVNEQLTLKAGFAYDQSPVHNARYRHPGGPDSDRKVLAIGSQLKLPAHVVLDAGYNLLLLADAKSRYHESCTINYFERPDNSVGPKDECTANGGDFRATYSNGRVHVLSFSLTKPL